MVRLQLLFVDVPENAVTVQRAVHQSVLIAEIRAQPSAQLGKVVGPQIEKIAIAAQRDRNFLFDVIAFVLRMAHFRRVARRPIIERDREIGDRENMLLQNP